MTSPFDYVNSIMKSRQSNMMRGHGEAEEKAYVPFLTNRSLSYHQDCILYANEMNMRGHLDKLHQ
jgi:hypothetical protein